MLNSRSKRLPTQNEDTRRIPQTVFIHVTRLHRLINDWIRIRDKGTKLCKAVIALKLHEFANDYYPPQLQPLVDGLLEALESLQDIVEGVALINKQLLAIAKLQQASQVVIFTWTTDDISDEIQEINNTLQEEIKLRKTITETMAHSRDEKLLELYATAWEFDTYFCVESSAYLFTEFGLSPIY